MSGNELKKSMEDLLGLHPADLKLHLSPALEGIRRHGIGKLLGEYPGFLADLLHQLRKADPARLLSEIPDAAGLLANLLWEGVALRASQSKTIKSALEKVERDFRGNIEASDSPFVSHFVIEKGRIQGGTGLLHFKDEDFRFMGPTEVLMDLLTGDLPMGFGNLRLQTAGHPGWVQRISPVMGQIGNIIKGT